MSAPHHPTWNNYCLHQFVNKFSLDNVGQLDAVILCLEQSGLTQVKPLPEKYVKIDKNFKITTDDKLWIPKISEHISPPVLSLSSLLSEEYRWHEDGLHLLKKKELGKDDWLSWAAYNADIQSSCSLFGTQL